MRKEAFEFPFPQQFSGEIPVCSCCHVVVPNGAPRQVRAEHVVHDVCAKMFDKVERVRNRLCELLDMIPKSVREKLKIPENACRICTQNGMRKLLRELVCSLKQKKRYLQRVMHRKYGEFAEGMKKLADEIQLGRVVEVALT